MEGKLFLLDNGSHVTVRDSNGTVVSFETLEEFNNHYSGSLDLSGEYYVDYEPDKKVYFVSARGNFEPLTNMWSGPIPDYEKVITDAAQMKSKLDDPYFRLGLEEARTYKLSQLTQSTYAIITKHMPEWKQAKQNDYIRLYEKEINGLQLTPLEQAVYDRFPGDTRSPEECYDDCIAAARWLMECVVQHNKKEKEIKKARTIKSIKAIKNPDYPQWER